MSIFPIFISVASGLLLISLFLWNMWVLLVALIMLVFCLVVYLYDMAEIYFSYESGFWLFVISEAIIFGTLIFCCLYFDLGFYESLSSALELPFLGCFLLLGSSITVTGFHHILGCRLAWVTLLLTVVLGVMFVVLQILEMNEVFMNIQDSSFYACSFCTVGLHFIHVALGIIGLIIVFIVGDVILGVYRCSVITWYWHFVDYIWLFVYTFVYVC